MMIKIRSLLLFSCCCAGFVESSASLPLLAPVNNLVNNTHMILATTPWATQPSVAKLSIINHPVGIFSSPLLWLGMCGVGVIGFWLLHNMINKSFEFVLNGMDLSDGNRMPEVEKPTLLEQQMNSKDVDLENSKTHQELAQWCNMTDDNSVKNDELLKTQPLCLSSPKVTGIVIQRKANEDHIFDWVSGNIRVIGICDGHGESFLKSQKIDNWTYKFFEHPVTKCQGYIPCTVGARLPVYLDEALSKIDTSDDRLLEKTVKDVFVSFNETSIKNRCRVMAKLNKQNFNTNYQGGSTCVLAIIVPGKNGADDKVVIANVGDSPAIAVTNDKKLWRTTDHVASNVEEEKRVENMGGKCFGFGGVKRLMGSLMVTRSFGDFLYEKQGMIAEPDVKIFNLKNLRGIFLYSDGFEDAVVKKSNNNAKNSSEKVSHLENMVKELFINSTNYKDNQKIGEKVLDYTNFDETFKNIEDDASFQLVAF